MLEIFKLGAILTQKGVIDEIKEVVIRQLDKELNIGYDRAESVVINVMNTVIQFLNERKIL